MDEAERIIREIQSEAVGRELMELTAQRRLLFEPVRADDAIGYGDDWRSVLPNLDPAALVEMAGRGLNGSLVHIFPIGQHSSMELSGRGYRGFLEFRFPDRQKGEIAGVEVSDQQHGIGKKMLANMVDVAEAIGLKELELKAAKVGAYFWARAGFVPSEEEWTSLRHRLDKRLRQIPDDCFVDKDKAGSIEEATRRLLASDDPRAVWAIADAGYPLRSHLGIDTLGKRLLIDAGWEGSLDLTDPASRARLDAYTGRSAQRIHESKKGGLAI